MAVSPWADHRASIDGKQLERFVAAVLRELGAKLDGFSVEEQGLVTAADGRYRIDVTARFRALDADFLVLVECKDHNRPVERKDVQVLADKKRTAGAHKAMLFSTNGFQSGAIEYAASHGIALIRVLEGALTWQTRLRCRAASATTALGEHPAVRRAVRPRQPTRPRQRNDHSAGHIR